MTAVHGEEAAVVAAMQAGDEAAFTALAERYRRELRVHCYRLLGSIDDAEDMVQESLLRAWRGRNGFEGRSLFRTWLYRIATNVCLKALERRPRRVMPPDLRPATSEPPDEASASSEIPWLQPYPDHLLGPLEPAAPPEAEPDAVVVSRETIELAYLAAIQHLPPRQRAILILRDALDWSAQETAALLDTSVAAVNSALQRARATMRERLPPRRLDWAPASNPSEEERAVLQRYMDAHDRADSTALAALLREDARLTMPPILSWYEGRDTVVKMAALAFDPAFGHLRAVPTGANRQPAAAWYLRRPGDTAHRALALDVLRIEAGMIAEITTFVSPELFPKFGLPPVL
jgi:RNA polymerase sigma-70 factor (ECF subfamily)